MPAIFGPSSILPRNDVKVMLSNPEKFNAKLRKWFAHSLVSEVGEFELLSNDPHKIRGTVNFLAGYAPLTFTFDKDEIITGLMLSDRGAYLATDVEEVLTGIATEELGLDFKMRPQPDVITLSLRQSGKQAASVDLGSASEAVSQGRQGETLFNSWIRQFLSGDQVIWLNARDESKEPYDFRLRSSVLVDVKAARHFASRVSASSAERDLAARGQLYIAVARLVHRDITIYEQRDGALHKVAQDEFLQRIHAV